MEINLHWKIEGILGSYEVIIDNVVMEENDVNILKVHFVIHSLIPPFFPKKVKFLHQQKPLGT